MPAKVSSKISMVDETFESDDQEESLEDVSNDVAEGCVVVDDPVPMHMEMTLRPVQRYLYEDDEGVHCSSYDPETGSAGDQELNCEIDDLAMGESGSNLSINSNKDYVDEYEVSFAGLLVFSSSFCHHCFLPFSPCCVNSFTWSNKGLLLPTWYGAL